MKEFFAHTVLRHFVHQGVLMGIGHKIEVKERNTPYTQHVDVLVKTNVGGGSYIMIPVSKIQGYRDLGLIPREEA